MKKIRFILPAIVLLVSLLTVSAQADELIFNGSFETPGAPLNDWTVSASIPGWSSTNGIELRYSGVEGTAYDGKTFIELDAYANSSISQTVATVASTQYTLSYYYAPRVNIGLDSNPIELWFNGTLIETATGNGAVSTAWGLHSFTVFGTGLDTIKFTAVGTNDSLGGSLDLVSLSGAKPVPVPAAVWLLGSGLFGLIGMKRKFHV